jgi:hypothetical protein
MNLPAERQTIRKPAIQAYSATFPREYSRLSGYTTHDSFRKEIPSDSGLGHIMLNLYCDTGGFHPEVRRLEAAGLLRIFHYPFENKLPRKGNVTVVPGVASTWDQSEHVTWDSDPGSWDDDQPTDQFYVLLKLINQTVDAQHLASAVRAGCKCFLTSDKGDIWQHRDAIRIATGLLVLHAPSELHLLKDLCGSTPPSK